jgi:Tfp pilus assembly protein FimT
MLKRKTVLSLSKPMFIAAFALAAVSTSAVADTLSVNSHTEQGMPNKEAPASQPLSQPSTVSCPATFHDVSITSDATQCQQFKTQVPAAMVYHTKQKADQVIAFYQTGITTLKVHAPVNQRTLLTSENNHTRIVISPDNAGSQVDILVVPKK